jgi:hypothetical protein
MIEKDERPRFFALGGKLGERGLLERLGLDQDALVHCVGPEPAVEVAREHALGSDLALHERAPEAVLGILRH